MRRPPNFPARLLYFVEAVPIYLLYGIFKLIPAGAASAVAGFIGRLVGPLLPISRRAYKNLSDTFPDMPRTEQTRIVREMWDNLTRLFAENVQVGKTWDRSVVESAAAKRMEDKVAAGLTGEAFTLPGKRIEILGAENFMRMMTHRGPAIIFTGHLGNWELLPISAAQFGAFSSVIFRTPNNPYVANLVRRARRGHFRLLPKGAEGAVAAGRTLENGGRLGMLADQKQNRGIAVPFFGRPAMTGTTLAKLALRYRCPVYGSWVRRTGGRKFQIILTPPLEYEITGDDEKDIYAITKQVNDMLEGWVREAPGQWLWLHRRWPKEGSGL